MIAPCQEINSETFLPGVFQPHLHLLMIAWVQTGKRVAC